MMHKLHSGKSDHAPLTEFSYITLVQFNQDQAKYIKMLSYCYMAIT